METKKCKKCDKNKSHDEFNKSSKNNDGLSFLCKECHSLYRRKHYLENKEKVIIQVNEYREANKEKYIKIANSLNQPNKKAGRIFETGCCICNKIVFVTKKDLNDIETKRYCSKDCRYKDNKSPYYHYLSGVKKRAIIKNLKFDLTEEFLKKILEVEQNNLCAITSCPIKIKEKKENSTLYDTASLDRIDNAKGYTKDNVQWVMLGINYMRLDFDINELHKTLQLIKENYKI